MDILDFWSISSNAPKKACDALERW